MMGLLYHAIIAQEIAQKFILTPPAWVAQAEAVQMGGTEIGYINWETFPSMVSMRGGKSLTLLYMLLASS